MSNKSTINELRNKRSACSCGHKLFIIVPCENGQFSANCFLCGEEKCVVVTASQMREEEAYENAMELIKVTTTITLTPETESKFGVDGTFNLYSQGMKDNHDLPDLEIRGVPGMFVDVAGLTINEINSYRIVNPDNPVLVGQTMQWSIGKIRIEQGDDWEGRFEWKAEDMLRLTSALTDVPCCHGCDCGTHGITE